MNSDIEKMNNALYNAAVHIAEAGKYISEVDKHIALKFMMTSNKLLSVIKPKNETKISKEEIDSILEEIFSLGN